MLRRRAVPAALRCRWPDGFFGFLLLAMFRPFFLLGLPITRLMISGVGFRLRWVVRRGALPRAVVFRRGAEFFLVRGRWHAALIFRRLPPNPARICFALSLRLVFATLLFLFLAGLTTLVSITE